MMERMQSTWTCRKSWSYRECSLIEWWVYEGVYGCVYGLYRQSRPEPNLGFQNRFFHRRKPKLGSRFTTFSSSKNQVLGRLGEKVVNLDLSLGFRQ